LNRIHPGCAAAGTGVLFRTVQQNGPVASSQRRPEKRKNIAMHGHIYNRRIRQPRHHKRRHAAALRAFTGAKLLLDIAVVPRSRCEAAQLVASTPRYIEAAITLIRAQDRYLIERVLAGDLSLLTAATHVRKRAKLLSAYREASAGDRAAASAAIGIDQVFDEMIVPSL
jgi:hypothetical protein